MTTNPIPEGFATITPNVIVKDAKKAIELYTKAFGAKEVYKMECPESGKVMHACLQIGSSKLFLADEFPKMDCVANPGASFYLYMPDVDAAFKQASQAGLKESSPPKDMFWGDRTGMLTDSFGNKWTVATHVRDVSDAEMEEAKKNMGKKAA